MESSCRLREFTPFGALDEKRLFRCNRDWTRSAIVRRSEKRIRMGMRLPLRRGDHSARHSPIKVEKPPTVGCGFLLMRGLLPVA